MGFLVRAVMGPTADPDTAVGYHNFCDPHTGLTDRSKGHERKYPGDIFEVEEKEFSDYHKEVTLSNGTKRRGWMEKLEEFPQPSWENQSLQELHAASKTYQPVALSQVAPSGPSFPGAPPPQNFVDAMKSKRGPGRPRKNPV